MSVHSRPHRSNLAYPTNHDPDDTLANDFQILTVFDPSFVSSGEKARQTSEMRDCGGGWDWGWADGRIVFPEDSRGRDSWWIEMSRYRLNRIG